VLLKHKIEILANDFDLAEILRDNDVEPEAVIRFLLRQNLIDLDLYFPDEEGYIDE
jgi:hypothetical protein